MYKRQIYYIEDQSAPLHNFDTTTMMFDPAPPMNAIAASETFSGGTFVEGVGSEGVGMNYCVANPNTTGSIGQLRAVGSPMAADNDLTLIASNLPSLVFGLFLTSPTQGFVTNPGGSQGNLCLGGAIGRYVGPGQVQAANASGILSLVLDLTQTPTPSNLVSIQAGETWNFQCWHRDGTTSNLTNGLEINFN